MAYSEPYTYRAGSPSVDRGPVGPTAVAAPLESLQSVLAEVEKDLAHCHDTLREMGLMDQGIQEEKPGPRPETVLHLVDAIRYRARRLGDALVQARGLLGQVQ